MLAALLVCVAPLALAQDGHGSDADATDHGATGHEAMPIEGNANLFPVAGLDLRVEPMLDLDGRFAVALSLLHETLMTQAPVEGVLVTPDGKRVSFAGDGAMLVTDVTPFSLGVYRLEGTVGTEPFSVEMTAQMEEGDLGSEIVMFLVPRPSSPMPTASHVVVYAFAEAENIHQRFAVTAAMPAMAHEDDDHEHLMMHSHFVHVPLADIGTDGSFDPMSNEVTIPFGMAGDWVLEVVIGTGFSAERASFDVTVGGE